MSELINILALSGMRPNKLFIRQQMAESAVFGEMLNEAIQLRHDKEKNQIVLISDLSDPKQASGETFKFKNVFKNNGFKWNGTHWTISADELEVAKRVVTIVNKADYLIDRLEDVIELTASAEGDGSGKSEITGKLESYINDLANAVDEKAMSDEIKRYLNFFANFYQYSFTNRILIYIQRPDATKVASFKAWKEKNRQVKKGARGINIFRPIFDDEKKNPLYKKDDADTGNLVGFKLVNVFDISDTVATGPEGEIPEEPKWWGENTTSETIEDLFALVKQVAENDGIRITMDDAKGGEKGYSAGKHINLSSDVAGAEKLAVMVHELAHEMMHWKESSKFYVGDDVKSNSALKELQAESVSFVVLKHYDIPVEHQSTYLALWKANSDKIKSNLKIISDVSQYIIENMDKLMGGTTKQDTAESILESMINSMVTQ